MVGYTLMHVYALPALLSGLCWIGVVIWLVVVLAVRLKGHRPFSVADRISLACAAPVVLLLVIPYGAWQAVTELSLGNSPAAANSLVSAATIGDRGAVDHLLGQGIAADSLDHNGCAALAWAANNAHAEIVSLLLSHGADANRTCNGETALRMAAESGDLATVKILLKAGAARASRNARGFTPADLAWGAHHEDVVQILEPGGTQR